MLRRIKLSVHHCFFCNTYSFFYCFAVDKKVIYVRFFTVWSPGDVGNHLRRRGRGRKQGLNSPVIKTILNALHVLQRNTDFFSSKVKIKWECPWTTHQQCQQWAWSRHAGWVASIYNVFTGLQTCKPSCLITIPHFPSGTVSPLAVHSLHHTEWFA